jgi:hypothetical protein
METLSKAELQALHDRRPTPADPAPAPVERTVATMEELEAEETALEAEVAAIRARATTEVPTPPSLVELEQFVSVTKGNLPFPRTPQAYAALPKTTRALVEKHLPALAQHLGANPEALPAAIEAKVLAGGVDYTEAELQHLTRAGYTDVVAQVRSAAKAYLENTWRTNRDARQAQREATRAQREEASRLERARLSAAQTAAARLKSQGW